MLSLLLLFACQDNALVFTPGEPSAHITSHADGDEVIADSTVQLRGVAGHRDLGPEDLRARWYVDDELACPDATPDDDGTTTCTATAAERVVLEVRDPDNLAAAAHIDLVLVDNTAPTARFTSPEDGDEAELDEAVRLQGLVSDAEDAPTALTVRFTSSLDGVLDTGLMPDEDGIVGLETPLSEGAHTLTLEVTDTHGATASDAVDFTVASAGVDEWVEVDALDNCGTESQAAGVAERVWIESAGDYQLTAEGGAYTSWGEGEDATSWVWTVTVAIASTHTSFDPLDTEVFSTAAAAEAAAVGSTLTVSVPSGTPMLLYKQDHSCTDNYGTVELSVLGPL